MSLFKKIIKIIFIIFIIAIILIASYHYLRRFLGGDYLLEQEMSELLEEDLELFTQVAEAYDSLRTEGAEFLSTKNDFWVFKKGREYNYANLKRGLIVVANPEFEWNDERITRLNNSKPWKVLNKWDIEDIYVSRNSKGVFFTNRTSIACAVLLVYCNDGVPEHEHFSYVEPIRENWYYCVLD